MLAGTGCTFSTNHLKPLTPSKYSGSVTRHDAKVAVVLQEVVPGKPLAETVWDENGPFWDKEHSKTIGFIQNYTDYFFWMKFHSRFMVPFGAIFSEVMTSAAGNSFSAYQVTSGPAGASSDQPAGLRITVTVDHFAVWEEPMGNMNLALDCHYTVVDPAKNVSHEFTLSRKRGPRPVGWTSKQAIDEIDFQVKNFTGEAVEEILKHSSP